MTLVADALWVKTIWAAANIGLDSYERGGIRPVGPSAPPLVVTDVSCTLTKSGVWWSLFLYPLHTTLTPFTVTIKYENTHKTIEYACVLTRPFHDSNIFWYIKRLNWGDTFRSSHTRSPLRASSLFVRIRQRQKPREPIKTWLTAKTGQNCRPPVSSFSS